MNNIEPESGWPLTDARMLTEGERQQLCRMLFNALLEMRMLGWAGKTEQAADLADAFHNLPAYLWSDQFSISLFREFLMSYHEKYGKGAHFNYLEMLDQIGRKREE